MKTILDILVSFFTNPCLILPLVASFTAQVLKYISRITMDHDWSLRDFFRDGGMPSSHSATVLALVTSMLWTQGIASPLFALSFVFASIVMRDAVGIRQEAGKQAVTIKKLAAIINQTSKTDASVRTEALKDVVGHTGFQVFMGALWGIFVAVIGCLILGAPFAVV